MSPAEITALRQKMGLSQNQFGMILGADQRVVSRWEKGVRPNRFYRAMLELLRKNHAEGKHSPDLADRIAAGLSFDTD